MKNYFRVVVASIILISGCKETKKEQEAVSETAIESSELDHYSDKFRKLVITEEGVLRGFNFITDSSEIRKNENAMFLSSNPKALSYTIEFNELEMADIIYHLKGNEVDTFEIDLYLKNKEATDSLVMDFKKFYNAGQMSALSDNDSIIRWRDNEKNVGVKLKYINKDIDHGLEVYLFPEDGKGEKIVQ